MTDPFKTIARSLTAPPEHGAAIVPTRRRAGAPGVTSAAASACGRRRGDVARRGAARVGRRHDRCPCRAPGQAAAARLRDSRPTPTVPIQERMP